MMMNILYKDQYYTKKIKLISGKISYRLSKSVTVLDEKILPKKYIKIVPETKVNKKIYLLT